MLVGSFAREEATLYDRGAPHQAQTEMASCCRLDQILYPELSRYSQSTFTMFLNEQTPCRVRKDIDLRVIITSSLS